MGTRRCMSFRQEQIDNRGVSVADDMINEARRRDPSVKGSAGKKMHK